MKKSARLLVFLAAATLAQPQYLAHVVAGGGGGVPASAGGKQAASVPLDQVTAVALDAAGNIYFADSASAPGSQLILQISPLGTLNFVAGMAGASGYSGDGLYADFARLDSPAGIAFDGAGNLYFADQGNNRIRRVDKTRIISTVAGNGLAADPSEPVPGDAGDGGPATLAQLNAPASVVIDSAGNLYISDTANCRIRRVDKSGNIATIAGTDNCGYSGDNGPAASAELNFPRGLAFDISGNLYIADTDNHRIRKVDPNGRISTIAGNGAPGVVGEGGPATSANLSWPTGVVPDNAGVVYVTDSLRVLKVGSDGTIARVIPSSVAASGLARDSAGNLYLALPGAVWKIAPGGQTSVVAGASGSNLPTGTSATQVSLGSPRAMVLASDGGFYFSTASQVYLVSAQGVISVVAGKGGVTGDGSQALNALLTLVAGLALDSAGNLYISDADAARIRKVDKAGIITTVAGTGTAGFSGDGGPAAGAQLNVPQGIAVDPSGNLYISDSLNHRVRRVTSQGVISTFAGTGVSGFSGDGGPAALAQLSAPSGLTFDAAGNLYIVDSSISYVCTTSTWDCNAAGLSNQRIRKVDAHGVITTIAGNGRGSYSGDGGPALQASLCFPLSVAVDAAGNIFILDAGNQVVRMVDTSGTISTLYFMSPNGPVAFGFSVDDYAKEAGAIAIDPGGNLYISAWQNDVVFAARRISTPYLSSMVNSASFSAIPGAQAAPGSLLTVYGLNLAGEVSSAIPPLPAALGKTTVTIGGTQAPLLYASASQINLLVPFETPIGDAAVAISTASGAANVGQASVTAVAPAIFRIAFRNQGAIVTADGSFAADFGPGTHPANRGEYVSIYCTGLGDVTNRPADGAPAALWAPYSETLVTPKVTIGGIPAEVTFSGLAPEFAGLYQVNVLVPENAPAGDSVPVTLSVGTAFDTVTMAIR